MAYFASLFILLVSISLSGCSPLAAVGAIGSTVNNAAYNSAERELNHPTQRRDEQALEVAIANMKLGIEYMQQGAYERALYNLKRSTLAKPDFAPAYNVLGLLYQKLGDMVEAENNFKTSLKLDASDSSTFNNYGLFLCSNQRYEEAESAFMSAANNPLYRSPEIALTNAGLCALDREPDKAENYFKLALKKNPNFPYALIQLSDIAYNQNQFELAYQYIERYKKNARHTPKSLWLGVRICKELGYEDDASSYALLLRNQFPDTKEAKMLAEWQL